MDAEIPSYGLKTPFQRRGDDLDDKPRRILSSSPMSSSSAAQGLFLKRHPMCKIVQVPKARWMERKRRLTSMFQRPPWGPEKVRRRIFFRRGRFSDPAGCFLAGISNGKVRQERPAIPFLPLQGKDIPCPINGMRVKDRGYKLAVTAEPSCTKKPHGAPNQEHYLTALPVNNKINN